ncbi:MAG: hypothetical protein ACLGHV_12700, partial [Gammaproteobacteria bacterium]
MSDRLAVLPQYLMPQRALTVAAGRIASARAGALTTALIRRFVSRYGVDMSEAANPDPASYASFNDFFTRPLKPGARPLAAADLIVRRAGATLSDHKGRDFAYNRPVPQVPSLVCANPALAPLILNRV